MTKYAILQNPGHNRVYFEASKKLSFSELQIASKSFSTPAVRFMSSEIAGVHYYIVECEAALSNSDIALISRLSPTYAIFRIVEMEGAEYFLPVEKVNSYYFSDDLNTILKYSGKTNEIFTRLMINAAVLASDFGWDEQLNLLDPLCGKGTTLYEALILGYNACGLDLNDKLVHEARVYFKKYLETGRYKHSFSTEKAATEDKRYITDRFKFSLARSKEDFKNDRTLRMEMLTGDCANVDRYFKKESFHVIVGDLPYGVQHGGKTGKVLSRSPQSLLECSLPAWHRLLRPGGVMALAYNSFVIKKDAIGRIAEENGFAPAEEEELNNLSHRVDQAIMRDIIVCRKKRC